MRLDALKLSLVTDLNAYHSFTAYKQFVGEVVNAGVTSVQLRAKHIPTDEVVSMAHELQAMLAPLNVPLIINDDMNIAHAVTADGVHLGQTDGAPESARALLGRHKYIGLSIETPNQIKTANQLGCIDYIAASAVFPSSSKSNCLNYWGIEGLTQLVAQSVHPVIAIGGIGLHNIREVVACGVAGVAVIAALHNALDPRNTARSLIEAIGSPSS